MSYTQVQEPELYILARRDGQGRPEIVYGSLAPTRRQAWIVTIEGELMGTGHTRETLKRQGYRATRAFVQLGWVPKP
jgi:hypothetical protein